MCRKEKGVTLVALIITIIVLLILAGVAFNTLLGDNGLLRRAQGAGEATTKAAENEAHDLNTASETMDNLINQYDLEVPGL